MRIVAVLNQKGGVGKTTTAVNLGAALALRGRRVLLIDADPQGNLTDHLGLEPGGTEASLYDVLLEDASIEAATVATETERLFVVPSEPDLAAAESELANELGREGRLSRALGHLDAESYDWILIDCPPSLGLLSINAMAAASELLITLQSEYFALKGLAALDDVIAMVQKHLNPELRLLGILPTLVNPVTILSKEVIEEVKNHYGEVVFGTRIRQNVSLAEAPSRGTHIFAYKPGSPGASDYLRLADEIEGRRDTRNRSHATRVAVAERTVPRAETPETPAPAATTTPPASEPPMPPPETGRTPALEPETPPSPEPEPTPTAAEPPVDRIVEAQLEPVNEPVDEPELPEASATPDAAPAVEEPAPLERPDVVELDVDEARAWFRDAMARRGN
ncbi:MAG: ParA family protein [Planctomycetota bacterium]|nr:ParA family protein [Planctomycetota bacterium]